MTIQEIAANYAKYRDCMNYIESQLREKQNINDKLDVLERFIEQYDNYNKPKEDFMHAVYAELLWYKEELKDGSRDILSNLNPNNPNLKNWQDYIGNSTAP